ncbi:MULTISPECIES: hypothetical protein [unclassified Bradyrhizobium]|nr:MULTISPECIES: hypothetical protein [unclassified Bradyrhizobium]
MRLPSSGDLYLVFAIAGVVFLIEIGFFILLGRARSGWSAADAKV